MVDFRTPSTDAGDDLLENRNDIEDAVIDAVADGSGPMRPIIGSVEATESTLDVRNGEISGGLFVGRPIAETLLASVFSNRDVSFEFVPSTNFDSTRAGV